MTLMAQHLCGRSTPFGPQRLIVQVAKREVELSLPAVCHRDRKWGEASPISDRSYASTCLFFDADGEHVTDIERQMTIGQAQPLQQAKKRFFERLW
jgi:hypothetical protein